MFDKGGSLSEKDGPGLFKIKKGGWQKGGTRKPSTLYDTEKDIGVNPFQVVPKRGGRWTERRVREPSTCFIRYTVPETGRSNPGDRFLIKKILSITFKVTICLFISRMHANL